MTEILHSRSMAPPKKYKDWILEYMEEHEVQVPVGARMRRSLNRYVAIKTHESHAQMVTSTWFNEEDALHYVRGLAFDQEENVDPTPANIHVLDFKERRKLVYEGGRSFRPVSDF